MRFRKSIKVAPGLKVNLSKSGVSATTGVKGLSVTTGKNGVYLNAGIPGTGVYDRKKIGSNGISNEISTTLTEETRNKKNHSLALLLVSILLFCTVTICYVSREWVIGSIFLPFILILAWRYLSLRKEIMSNTEKEIEKKSL